MPERKREKTDREKRKTVDNQKLTGQRYLVVRGTHVTEVDEVGFAIAQAKKSKEKPNISLLPTKSSLQPKPQPVVESKNEVVEAPSVVVDQTPIQVFAPEIMEYQNQIQDHPLLEAFAENTGQEIELTAEERRLIIRSQEFSFKQLEDAINEGFKRWNREARIRISASYLKVSI